MFPESPTKKAPGITATAESKPSTSFRPSLHNEVRTKPALQETKSNKRREEGFLSMEASKEPGRVRTGKLLIN